jgi:predicted nuclease of predicted toxin-antitoxin system
MRRLLDVGVAPSIGARLRHSGHDVVHLSEAGLERLPDDEIFAKAAAEKRVMITFDLDFADIVAAAGSSLPSVVLLPMRNARVANVSAKIIQLLPDLAPQLASGAVAVVEDTRTRVRRLPLTRGRGF